MKKWRLSLLLCAVMVLTMVLTVSAAEGSEDVHLVYIDDVGMGNGTIATYYVNGATEAVTQEPDNWNAKLEFLDQRLTLTVRNLSVTSAFGYEESAIYAGDDLVLVIEGNNMVVGPDDETLKTQSNGVKVRGTLTICGTGALTTSGRSGLDSSGIYAKNDITILSGTVTAIGQFAQDESRGIRAADEAGLFIRGGRVTLLGGDAVPDLSCDRDSYGAAVEGAIVITDGVVEAYSSTNAEESYGLFASRGIRIEGGQVNCGVRTDTAVSPNLETCCAINSPGMDVTITGGVVTAIGGPGRLNSCGIYTEGWYSAGNITISGGTVIARGVAAEEGSAGIYAVCGDVTITNAEVTASGQAAAYLYGGIVGSDTTTLTIVDSTVEAEGPCAVRFSSVSLGEKMWYQWTTAKGGVMNTTEYVYAVEGEAPYFKVERAVPAACTVTFDANGGSGNMAPISVPQNSVYHLPESTFSAPAGMQFKAWCIDGMEYAVGASCNVTEDMTLTALWSDVLYAVSVINGTGSGTYYAGSAVTITANPVTGSTFHGWTVEGADLTLPGQLEVTFTMPASNITVTANYQTNFSFTSIPLSIVSASASEGGKGSLNGRYFVVYGKQMTYTATPDEGYVLTALLVNGQPVEVIDNTYTFRARGRSFVIEAIFSEDFNHADEEDPAHDHSDAGDTVMQDEAVRG